MLDSNIEESFDLLSLDYVLVNWLDLFFVSRVKGALCHMQSFFELLLIRNGFTKETLAEIITHFN